MFWIILALLFFRWPILERYIGTIRMFLFDAVLYTILAAICISQPGELWPWLSYIVGGFCVVMAIVSGNNYLMYSAVQRWENEQGKSDSGPT